jgi:hypothetical protein
LLIRPYKENDLAHKAAEAYLKSQSDWTSEENIKFMAQFMGDVKSKTYSFLLSNTDAFGKILGSSYAHWLKSNGGLSSIRQFYNPNENNFDDKAFPLLKNYLPEKFAQEIIAFSEIVLDEQSPIDDAKIKKVEAYLDNYAAPSDVFLNFWAWTVYEKSDDTALLNKALKWSLKSIETQDVYMTNDTAAALYYKLEIKEKAIEYANRALARAKVYGEKTSETEKLLVKINKM